MKDTKYLFQRNRTWWVKVAVPSPLRELLGYDLRQSLHTQRIDEARAARDEVVSELFQKISDARDGLEKSRACKESTVPDDESGFEILTREDFSDVTFLLEVDAPLLARAAKPGQPLLPCVCQRPIPGPLPDAGTTRLPGKTHAS